MIYQQEFTRAVARMRVAQREYFKDRTGRALRAAKRYEEAVDKMLEEMGFKREQAQPLKLWEDAEKVN